MVRNFNSQRERAQMGHLAEKFNGRFGVAAFQFAVCRTHAAQRLNAAFIAFRLAGLGLHPCAQQEVFPAILKASSTPAVGFLVGENADAHLACGIYGATADSAAAEVNMVGIVIRPRLGHLAIH